MNKITIFLSLILLLAFANPVTAQKTVWFKLPPVAPPELFGNILIDRTSTDNGVKPVTFSHWSHRLHYTCRVCHFELEFDLITNSTMITEEQNKYGRYCGACHNDNIAFGHTRENCDKCHNGDISYGKEKFKNLSSLSQASSGNGVDWVKALENEEIKPATYVLEEDSPMEFQREIMIESPWAGISPVFFPHNVHGKLLDCSNCHPEIFAIEQYATEDLAMESILKSEFCGVCHGKVAFPTNENCKRCHPGMKHPGKALDRKH